MVAFRRAGATANNGLSTVTASIPYTVPSTAQPGDFAVAVFEANGSGPTVTAAPSGWTQLGSAVAQGSTLEMFVYYKLLVAGDIGAAANWTLSATGRGCGVMDVFGGVDGWNTINASQTSAAVAATSQSAPAVTSTVWNALIYNVWIGRDASGGAPVWTIPGTHTAGSTCGTAFGTSGINVGIASATVTTQDIAKAYGAYSATASFSANAVMLSMALAPTFGGRMMMLGI